MTRAMVLAAGLGTRLYPLSTELPKPLMPLGDSPALAQVGRALERAGVESAVVNAHHLAPLLREFVGGYPFFRQIVEEPEIRGTAGGVAGARPWLGRGPIIVSNADLLSEPPVAALIERVREGGMSMAVSLRSPGEGRVGLGADGRVVRLRDERFGEETSGADYLSVCALGDDVLSALPERGCLVADVALPRLRAGLAVTTVVTAAGMSMGDSVADYLDANRAWLRARGLASLVAPDALVASEVTIERSVVGAGAEITGSGQVSGCVIWPGARARAPLQDAVVTASGQVVRRDGAPAAAPSQK